jgi:hypothetical protein
MRLLDETVARREAWLAGQPVGAAHSRDALP